MKIRAVFAWIDRQLAANDMFSYSSTAYVLASRLDNHSDAARPRGTDAPRLPGVGTVGGR